MSDNPHRHTIVIQPAQNWLAINWRELWEYRDLLVLLVRRDFVARYKQTILGPAWAIIQPLVTSVVFTLVFGRIAKIPTDGVPPFLFYLTGMLFWQLFAQSVQSGGNALQGNVSVFGKIYFPRLIPSIANQISQLIPFVIQTVIFIGFYLWFLLATQDGIVLYAERLLWVPLLLAQVLVFALGLSLAYSALTAKYRDFQHALGFLIQLGLYATPVIYPISAVPEKWQWVIWINPMAAPISGLKWALLNAGELPLSSMGLAWAISLFTLFVGIFWFQRVQRTFIDTA